ncbi:MAG: hypothetical protein JOZ57_05175, partial [Abitibacteriaceae bacterium]|nr:hypothetical protein [Abditibacteriaceae bacterium]
MQLRAIQKTCLLLLSVFTLFAHTAQTKAADSASIFNVPRLYNITVDGKADDWAEQGFRLDVLTPATGQLPPATEFDARARVGWNDQGLLVLLQVDDKDITEAKDENKLYERDSVELFMATQRGAADRYQIILSPGLEAAHPQLRWHLNDQRQNADLKKINISILAARTKTATGYTLEVLLPWEGLAIKPEVGREIALQLGVNDWNNADKLFRAMGYPALGADSDSNKMQRVRLAAEASSPVRAVATGGYERFRRTRIDVTATADQVGKPVEVREGLRALGAGQLTSDGEPAANGRARAKVLLPMPARGQAYGPLTVSIAGEPITTLNLPDPNAARRDAFADADFIFQPFTFSGTSFPNGDFQNPSLVEDLIGPYTLKTTFYDAAYNVVTSAQKPGRYGAIVEITGADGQPYKRFYTLFRQPAE